MSIRTSYCQTNNGQHLLDKMTDNQYCSAVFDHYNSSKGYLTFIPESPSTDTKFKNVVTLVHGYGALNPRVFGAWIKHLLEKGNIVVYPRYQRNLVFPSSSQFTPNAVRAMRKALKELREECLIDEQNLDLYLVGHSFGGVINANILKNYKAYGLPKPAAALICEPGTGPFTGALLESYDGIDKDIPTIIVVGTRDYTVGEVFGRRLFQDMSQSEDVLLIRQFAARKGNEYISASHYEPYAIDNWCDIGLENLTSRRADMVGKIDQVNYNGYWKWLDQLIDYTSDRSNRDSLFSLKSNNWHLGHWADGERIDLLQCVMHDKEVSPLLETSGFLPTQ